MIKELKKLAKIGNELSQAFGTLIVAFLNTTRSCSSRDGLPQSFPICKPLFLLPSCSSWDLNAMLTRTCESFFFVSCNQLLIMDLITCGFYHVELTAVLTLLQVCYHENYYLPTLICIDDNDNYNLIIIAM